MGPPGVHSCVYGHSLITRRWSNPSSWNVGTRRRDLSTQSSMIEVSQKGVEFGCREGLRRIFTNNPSRTGRGRLQFGVARRPKWLVCRLED